MERRIIINHDKLPINLSKFVHYFKKLYDGKMTWRIGIYVRLSKEDGNSVSASIENQIKRIARYLRDFEDFVIYDIYIDDGLTGTDFNREDYIRLQNDVKSKRINCVVFKDLTRYARNLADGIKELDTFVLEHKIRFISLRPEVDTFKNPRAISSAEVYEELQQAEAHARTTSLKVREIKELQREDGEPTGGFPPYGFIRSSNSKEWIIDEYASEIIKKIFKWYADGLSINNIAKKLNSLGILNPTAYKQSIGLKYKNPHAINNSGLWWPTTVSRILEDKNYIGYSVQGKSSSFDHKRHKQEPKPKEEYIEVANAHEKAVDEELFNLAINNKKQHARATKSGEKHIFSNLVCCANCKRSMARTNSGKNVYLVCRTYRTFGKEYCNERTSINYEQLEKIVLKSIQAQINLIDDLQEVIEKINQNKKVNNKSSRIDKLIKNNEQQIAKEINILDESYYDWKNGDISKEQYHRVKEEKEKKIEQLRETLYYLSEQERELKKGIDANNIFFTRFLKYKNIESLDRKLLLELIEKIYIYPNKEVEIKFKFQDEYLLILDYIEENTKNTKQKIKTKIKH